jgi:hypothetical protein
LADPRYGALVLEVKGGTVRYDAQRGLWTSIGRHGEGRIKDPFAQARRSMHTFIDALEKAKGGRERRINVGYAVAFPDGRATRSRLKPDAPREIVIDGGDLRSLGARVEAIFRYWAGRTRMPAPGKGGISP